MSYYEKVEAWGACLEEIGSSRNQVMFHILQDEIDLVVFKGREHMMIA